MSTQDDSNARHQVGAPSAFHHVAAATWLIIDVGALAILVLLEWVLQPSKGLLPSPTWLFDPLAGWLVGNIIGIVAYKALMRLTPWALAAVALVFVALSPAVFVKFPALSAFAGALAIGVAGGALYWRAHKDAPGPLL